LTVTVFVARSVVLCEWPRTTPQNRPTPLFTNHTKIQQFSHISLHFKKDKPNWPVAHQAIGKKYILIGPQLTC